MAIAAHAIGGEVFRRGDFAAMPGHVSNEMVDTYTAAGPLDKVRERDDAVAERGNGIWCMPPTYFLPPEQIASYQRRIVQEFAPNGAGA